MAVNEIRVVLTDDQGNSLASGQGQEVRGSVETGLGLGASAGLGSSLISSYREKKIKALNEWEDNEIAEGRTGITWGRSKDRISRAFNRSKGLLMATDKDLSAFERKMGAGQFLRNISAPTAKQSITMATAGLQVANIGFDIAEHNASNAGNTHKASSLSNTQNAINDASGILLATALNPVAGLGMIALTAYRKVMEHDKYINEMKINDLQATHYARRISETTSGSRVSV